MCAASSNYSKNENSGLGDANLAFSRACRDRAPRLHTDDDQRLRFVVECYRTLEHLCEVLPTHHGTWNIICSSLPSGDVGGCGPGVLECSG